MIPKGTMLILTTTLTLLLIDTIWAVNYPLRIDILADPVDYDRIYNVTENFINSHEATWQSASVFPASFVITTNSDTAGDQNFLTKETTTSLYIDVRKRPTSIQCILAKHSNISYIRTSVQLTNDCDPDPVRPSVTEYLNTAQQLFDNDGYFYDDVILLTEFIHDIDTRIFQTRFNSTLRLKQFVLNDAYISPTLQPLFNDSNTQLLVMFATYAMIESTFSKIVSIDTSRLDHWIFVPTDSFDCPLSMNFSFSFVCLRHDKQDFNYIEDGNASLADSILYQSLEELDRSLVEFPAATDIPASVTASQRLAWHIKNTFEADVSNMTLLVDKFTLSFPSGTVDMKTFGNWTRLNGVNVESFLFEPLPGSVIVVVFIHEPPFVIRFTNSSGTYFRGYSVDVLDRLAAELGFSYVAHEVQDQQYGIEAADGSWTGVIGEVMTGKADLAVGPISVTTERESVIDFTLPYYDYAGLQILMRDNIASKSMFGFVDVFDELVWVAWFGFLSVTAILMYLFHRFTLRPRSLHGKSKTFSVNDTLWFIMASITVFGPDKNPEPFAGRALIIGFWFFCQIMMATYTANLAAFMTSRRLSHEIQSLSDLAGQTAIKYSTVSGSMSQMYFERMYLIENNFFEFWKNVSYSATEKNELAVWDYPLGDLYTRLYHSINETGFLINSGQGIERVLQGNFAFIHETPMIKYEVTRQCNLLAIGDIFSPKPYAFVLPENSPLVEDFNSKILELQSGTFFTTLKEKWWPETLSCPTVDDSTAGLSFEDLSGVFVVAGSGCGIGLIVLSIEIFWNRRMTVKKREKKKQDKDKGDISIIETEKVPFPPEITEKSKLKESDNKILTITDMN